MNSLEMNSNIYPSKLVDFYFILLIFSLRYFYSSTNMLDWIRTKTNKHRQDFGKFNFHIKSEPQLIDSSTTLTLTAYSNLFQNATIPCVYRWSTLKNGFKTDRPEFRGCSFRCEPSDVGAIVQAEVIVRFLLFQKSTDSEYGGTAVIHFGPVKLDQNLKKPIESALGAGGYVISAKIVMENQQRDCQISLSEDLIKINHIYSEAHLIFEYSLNEPSIVCPTKDLNSIFIRFNEKQQKQLNFFIQKLFPKLSSIPSNSLEIKFANHSSRDIFIFVWKGLKTKKQLRLSKVDQNLVNIDFKRNQALDYLMEIEGLKSNLSKMDKALKKAHQQKVQQAEEIVKLKNQIKQLVSTYTQMVEQKSMHDLSMSQNSSFISSNNNQVPSNRYKHLYNQNHHLNTRIHTLTKEIDAIRFQPQKFHSPRGSSEFVVENIKSPFSKKKTQDDSQHFISMLEDLSSSRISYISEIGSAREDFELKNRFEQSEKEKEQLQKKLQLSFQKIEKLQTELNFNRSAILNPINSFVNFYQEKHQILNENTILKQSNNTFINQNRKLQEQLNRSHQIINEQKSFAMMSRNGRYLDGSFVSTKTEKKAPIFMEHQDKQLLAILMKKENEIVMLKQKIQKLEKQNLQFRDQVLLSKQNLDSLNHSQQLSQQMSTFNDQQMEIVKKHNQFLTNENAKLSRACQKYMNQARECIKLRMEIMKLRERLGKQKAY